MNYVKLMMMSLSRERITSMMAWSTGIALLNTTTWDREAEAQKALADGGNGWFELSKVRSVEESLPPTMLRTKMHNW